MRFFVRLEEWLLIILMAVICIITFLNVVTRYFLHFSFSFTEELTSNLIAYVIFVGAALLARENGHIGFSLLSDALPSRVKIIITIIVGCLTTVFFLILLYYGMKMVIQQYNFGQMTPAMRIPAWIFGFSIPLGAFLCIYRFWEGHIKEIRKVRSRENM